MDDDNDVLLGIPTHNGFMDGINGIDGNSDLIPKARTVITTVANETEYSQKTNRTRKSRTTERTNAYNGQQQQNRNGAPTGNQQGQQPKDRYNQFMSFPDSSTNVVNSEHSKSTQPTQTQELPKKRNAKNYRNRDCNEIVQIIDETHLDPNQSEFRGHGINGNGFNGNRNGNGNRNVINLVGDSQQVINETDYSENSMEAQFTASDERRGQFGNLHDSAATNYLSPGLDEASQTQPVHTQIAQRIERDSRLQQQYDQGNGDRYGQQQRTCNYQQQQNGGGYRRNQGNGHENDRNLDNNHRARKRGMDQNHNGQYGRENKRARHNNNNNVNNSTFSTATLRRKPKTAWMSDSE